ncbi:MAG TPA: alpha/beta hydrolase [Stellaceae bacterium]|jgi:pimeloyl-ACP methyl ester carboxylesterase
MAAHIDGPLYYERLGRAGPVMAFVHPNPMDQSCWLYQMARFSTWYRCIAIDIPGYGRSPKATAGLSVADMAEACWEAIDDAFGKQTGEPAILVGCSVGSIILPWMHHARPEKTRALILSGTGYNPKKDFAQRRIDGYTRDGVAHRWGYTFEDLSPAFRATPLAHYFAELFTERNDTADAATIIHQFRALQQQEPEGHFERVACPTVILTGNEDTAHPSAFALQQRIPKSELRVLPGAGHACYLEQPWLFDRFMIEFLEKNGLFAAPR